MEQRGYARRQVQCGASCLPPRDTRAVIFKWKSTIARAETFQYSALRAGNVDMNQVIQLMGSIVKIEPIEDFSAPHGGFEENPERDDLALVVSSSPLVG